MDSYAQMFSGVTVSCISCSSGIGSSSFQVHTPSCDLATWCLNPATFLRPLRTIAAEIGGNSASSGCGGAPNAAVHLSLVKPQYFGTEPPALNFCSYLSFSDLNVLQIKTCSLLET